MITEIKGKCQYEGCEQPAEVIACGREWASRPLNEEDVPGHPKPALYCKAHGRIVSDEGPPEYNDTCPNCGCEFGIN